MEIYPILTGHVKVKQAQLARRPGGMLSVLFGTEWSEWLPIYAWLIDHPEDIILVDTGETARTSDPGYFTSWHPYFRMAARMRVQPQDEVGTQLRAVGIDPAEVDKVVMTHMHTDHAGGLHHFPNAEFFVSETQIRMSDGFFGKLLGYLPQHRPDWFDPEPVTFDDGPYGPFAGSSRLTRAGDVLLVPTPGHTPGHLSVIVRTEDVSYFLAGDVSYTEAHLRSRIPDGVGPRASVSLDTIDRVIAYTEDNPTVYLPSHDPASADRLAARKIFHARESPSVPARESTSTRTHGLQHRRHSRRSRASVSATN